MRACLTLYGPYWGFQNIATEMFIKSYGVQVKANNLPHSRYLSLFYKFLNFNEDFRNALWTIIIV